MRTAIAALLVIAALAAPGCGDHPDDYYDYFVEVWSRDRASLPDWAEVEDQEIDPLSGDEMVQIRLQEGNEILMEFPEVQEEIAILGSRSLTYWAPSKDPEKEAINESVYLQCDQVGTLLKCTTSHVVEWGFWDAFYGVENLSIRVNPLIEEALLED